jgi:hypothetical protein
MPWCRAVRPVQQAGHKQPAGRMIGRDCGAFRLDHRAKARVVVASYLGWMLEAFDCAVVGVCRDGAVARGRCLPYANHGAGRVGRDPGTFERAAAG